MTNVCEAGTLHRLNRDDGEDEEDKDDEVGVGLADQNREMKWVCWAGSRCDTRGSFLWRGSRDRSSPSAARARRLPPPDSF